MLLSRQLSAVSGWPQLFASSSLSLQPKFCIDTSPVHRLSSSYVSPTSARMMTHLGQERTEQETWRSMTFLQVRNGSEKPLTDDLLVINYVYGQTFAFRSNISQTRQCTLLTYRFWLSSGCIKHHRN